jgi:hypothetical protein
VADICTFTGVCQRRHWPDPLYEPYGDRDRYYCKVVVNNREYCTDVPYETEELARDGAAMKAFMICRNFSSNDGYYPGQRPGQRSANGVVQGVPVPIGTGRRSNRSSAGSYDSTVSEGTSSGGNSPKSVESGFGTQLRQAIPHMPKAIRHQQHRDVGEYICLCRRAPVHAYGRCGWCLQESGWA